MTTTPTAPAPTAEAVDALLGAIYGNALVASTADLAAGIGVGIDSLFRAAERGDLQMLRVSARRLVIARPEARRYLIALQERS